MRAEAVSIAPGIHMDQIQKHVAELAIRLLAMPADGVRNDHQALGEIERLATQILKEVAAARVANSYLPGERTGLWRIASPRP